MKRLLQRGFTLIELMVVVALIAIFAFMASPSVSQILANQELRSATSDLLASLMNARGAAIQKGQRVYVAPISNNDWTTGWNIFIDTNNNFVFDTGDQLLDTRQALSQSVMSMTPDTGICTNSGTATSPRVIFAYENSGFLANVNGSSNGYVRFQAPLTNTTRCVVVDLSGRGRTCQIGTGSSAC